ncbi:Group 4 capsule polysaccharide lipoprotein gfcB, YjbF [compost metagenome]
MMRDGLVVRTVGFGHNLAATRLAAGAPFAAGLHKVADGTASQRWVDFADGYQIGVPVQSRFEKKGLEQVDILGRSHTLLRVDESLSAPIDGLDVVNSYWVDPADGFVMASRQQVAPSLQVVITQIRPYRGNAQ